MCFMALIGSVDPDETDSTTSYVTAKDSLDEEAIKQAKISNNLNIPQTRSGREEEANGLAAPLELTADNEGRVLGNAKGHVPPCKYLVLGLFNNHFLLGPHNIEKPTR